VDLRTTLRTVIPRARPEPLKVSDLPRNHRIWARAGLLLIAVWCAALLVIAVWGLPNTVYGSMGATGFALLTRLLTLLSLAVGAALAGTAVTHQPVRWKALIVSSLAALGLVLNFASMFKSLLKSPAFEVQPPDLTNAYWPDVPRLLAVSFSALGLISAMTVPVLARRPVQPRIIVGAVVLPYLSCPMSLLFTGELWRPWEANVDYRNDILYMVIPELEVMLIAYLLYAFFMWVDLVQDVTVQLGPLARRVLYLLPALLLVKLIWIGLGLLNALPSVLGGAASAWDRSLQDGLAGWITAALVGAGVLTISVGTYLRPTASLRNNPRELDRPLTLILLVLSAPALLAGAIAVLLVLLPDVMADSPPTLVRLIVMMGVAVAIGRLVPEAGVGRTETGRRWRTVTYLAVGGSLLIGIGFSNPLPSGSQSDLFWRFFDLPTVIAGQFFLAVIAALVLALAFFIHSGFNARTGMIAACFLTVVGIAHAVPLLRQFPLEVSPTLAGATGDLVRPLTATQVVWANPPPWSLWWASAPGTFTRPTLDSIVTLFIVLLAISTWRTRAHLWPFLLVVLATSTVVGQADIVRPTGWVGDFWFYVAFIVPVVYDFLIHAGDLNRTSDDPDAVAARDVRVLLRISSLLVLLAIAGYSICIGQLGSEQSLEGQVFSYGRGITAQFLLMLITWSLITTRLAPRMRAEPAPVNQYR
jgi:hypothetical protein